MEQSDQIQNLLRLKGEDQNTKVESDVLEAQTINENYATFNLQKKGLLSPSSRLIIPLYASGLNKANCRLPMYSGAYIIKNATIRTGSGVVLAQSSRINMLCSMRNAWKDQSSRQRRGQFVNGCWNVWEYTTDNNGTGNVVYTGKYGIGGLEGADQKPRFKLGETDGNGAINDDDCVEYSIALSELFPEMMPITLPLFALSESVQLFLEFAPQQERKVSGVGVEATQGDVLINTNQVKFVSDHIYYSGDSMSKLQAVTTTSTGLPIAYGDYNTIDLTYTKPTTPAAGSVAKKTFVNSIGMAGLRVKHLLMNVHNNDASQQLAQKIGGNFATVGDRGGSGSCELQLQVNNINYYNEPLTNDEFWRELTDCYGVDASIPYPVYTAVGAVSDGKFGDTANVIGTVKDRCLITTDGVFTGTPVEQRHLLASQQYMGVNFTHDRTNNGMNGIEVGQSPVQITFSKNFTDLDAYNLENTIFACVQRVMVIKNGDVIVNFS